MASGAPKGSGKPLTSSLFYILLALADAPRYGLGISAEVEERTGGNIQLGPGTLYNAIKNMLASGLIAVEEERPAVGADDPRRRYYRITEEGRRALEQEVLRLDLILDVAREKRVLPERRPA